MWHQRKFLCDNCQQLLLFLTHIKSNGSGTEGVLWGEKNKNGCWDCSGENGRLKVLVFFYDATYFPTAITYYRLKFSPVQEKNRNRGRSWIVATVCSVQNLMEQKTIWSHTNVAETTLTHSSVTCIYPHIAHLIVDGLEQRINNITLLNI